MYLSFEEIFPDETYRLKKKEKNFLQQYSKCINNECDPFSCDSNICSKIYPHLNAKNIEIIRFFKYLLAT